MRDQVEIRLEPEAFRHLPSPFRHTPEAAQTEAKPRRSSNLRSCHTKTSHSPSTLSITTPSPLSQTYLTDPTLYLTLTARDTFFLTKCCCRLIFKPSFILLLISFTLLTFPSTSCWVFPSSRRRAAPCAAFHGVASTAHSAYQSSYK